MRPPRFGYGLWIAVALGLHLALLFAPGPWLRTEAIARNPPGESVELSLVAAPPETAAAPSPPVAPEPEPPAPLPAPVASEPLPEPVPDPEPAKTPAPPALSELSPKVERPRRPAATPAPHRGSGSRVPRVAGSSEAGGSEPRPGSSGAPGNSRASYLSNPQPSYPPEAKRDHEQGLVMLTVAVDERGAVVSVEVRQGCGFPRLEQAALEGVRHWRFHPARLAGVPVSARLIVPIRFQLGE